MATKKVLLHERKPSHSAGARHDVYSRCTTRHMMSVHRQMYRVLKPGGKAWISDLRRDVSNATIDSFVNDTMKIRGLSGVFMKYTFKHTLRPRALTGTQFKELIAKTPFTKVEITENAMDLEVLLDK